MVGQEGMRATELVDEGARRPGRPRLAEPDRPGQRGAARRGTELATHRGVRLVGGVEQPTGASEIGGGLVRRAAAPSAPAWSTSSAPRRPATGAIPSSPSTAARVSATASARSARTPAKSLPRWPDGVGGARAAPLVAVWELAVTRLSSCCWRAGRVSCGMPATSVRSCEPVSFDRSISVVPWAAYDRFRSVQYGPEALAHPHDAADQQDEGDDDDQDDDQRGRQGSPATGDARRAASALDATAGRPGGEKRQASVGSAVRDRPSPLAEVGSTLAVLRHCTVGRMATGSTRSR